MEGKVYKRRPYICLFWGNSEWSRKGKLSIRQIDNIDLSESNMYFSPVNDYLVQFIIGVYDSLQ